MEETETNDSPFSSHFLVGNDEHDIVDVPLDASSSLDGSEPIYEGEDFVQDLALKVHVNDEPVYEGELLLAEQSDKEREGVCGSALYEGTKLQCLEPMTPAAREGESIRNFLTNNASQLTIYGYMDMTVARLYACGPSSFVSPKSTFLFHVCSLFCLQEYLKEHSLCVFFRNNHFSTMFKIKTSDVHSVISLCAFIDKKRS